MTLKETGDLMFSDDHRERLKAEFFQTYIRMERLEHLLSHREFIPTCPIELLEKQYEAMKDYLLILVKRMVIEGVELG